MRLRSVHSHTFRQEHARRMVSSFSKKTKRETRLQSACSRSETGARETSTLLFFGRTWVISEERERHTDFWPVSSKLFRNNFEEKEGLKSGFTEE